MNTAILETLQSHKDDAYQKFQAKLIPTIDSRRIIGVRTTVLRAYAKELQGTKQGAAFLYKLPHEYFEENQLHAFIVSLEREFDTCIEELERFLPYIDNWATCDQTSPKIFKKNKDRLLPFIRQWIKSPHTYTVRFAIGMLMQHYLVGDFEPEYLDMVTGIKSDEYYINMEIAWYMATALAKQWDSTIPYLENRRMDKWVHNKTIQKARESYRITDEQKAYVKGLKR